MHGLNGTGGGHANKHPKSDTNHSDEGRNGYFDNDSFAANASDIGLTIKKEIHEESIHIEDSSSGCIISIETESPINIDEVSTCNIDRGNGIIGECRVVGIYAI